MVKLFFISCFTGYINSYNNVCLTVNSNLNVMTAATSSVVHFHKPG